MPRVPMTHDARPAPHVRWAEGLLLAGIAVLLLSRALPTSVPAVPDVSGLTHRVELNRAGWRDLVDLPGIGEVRAREIVAERRRRGPFRSVTDLVRVRGIGPVTVARLRGYFREGR